MRKATAIYYNGTILTMDSRASKVSAIAVDNDTILGLGSKRDIQKFKASSTELIDLQGKTMLPGFIDAHSHIITAGMLEATQLYFAAPPVGKIKNISMMKEVLKAAAQKKAKGEWILGYAYDDTAMEEKRHPLASDIDEVCPNNPVFIRHVSGHLGVLNSKALELVGYNKNTVDPFGGVIRRDANGNPTGVLEEPPAMYPLFDILPSLTDADWLRGIEIASHNYLAKGVTSAQDGATDDNAWGHLKAAHAKGKLGVRVQILPRFGKMNMSQFSTHKSGTQLTKDKMLGLGAVKMLSDGSLQGYSGYLSIPYHKVIYDLPEKDFWRGYPLVEKHVLLEKVLEAHKAGFQIAVHGNGDNAIQDILDAFEEANKVYPRADARHIIIHCQTVREDQLDRIKRLGVVPAFFVVHTYYWGDRHRDIFLGADRANRINPLNSALKRGILFTNHNDTFVTPIDPLLSVWSAVNRITSSGKVLGKSQCIPVVEALRSVTSWAAYQACEEDLKGSLETGKLADFVILEANPLKVKKEKIKDIPIVATIVGGKLAYGKL